MPDQKIFPKMIKSVLSSTRLAFWKRDEEEAQQTLYLILLDLRNKYPDAPLPLLQVMLLHRAIDIVRREWRSIEVTGEIRTVGSADGSKEKWSGETAEMAEELSPSPERIAAARRLLVLVDAVLDAREREILLDHAQQGLSQEQIAVKHGLSKARIGQIIQRARGKISHLR